VRTEANVSAGRSAARIAAKNVGPEKNSVGAYRAMTSAATAGEGRRGSSTALAPTDSGKKTELPMPYAKNIFATEKQTSSGVIARTCLPYVSTTCRMLACRCIAAFGVPVVPEV
jgi:hypothetical protein